MVDKTINVVIPCTKEEVGGKMFLEKAKKSNDRISRNLIFSVLIMLISFDLISIFLISSGKLPLIEVGNVECIVSIGNGLISVMGVLCSYMYYYIYKQEKIFIITQAYTMTAIYYIFNSTLINDSVYKSESDFGISVFLNVIMALILFITLNENSKLSKFISENKLISLLTVPVIMELLLAAEYEGKVRGVSTFNKEVLTCICVIAFLYNIYFIVDCLKKSITENRFIYSIYAFSINMLFIKALYEAIYSIRIGSDFFSLILYFLSFNILVVGLFIQMFFTVQESNELRVDFKLFYDAVENDSNCKVIVYDEFYNAIYANKLMREKISQGEISLEEQYSTLKELSTIYQTDEKIESVYLSIREKGYYDEIVHRDNGQVDEIHIQEIIHSKETRFLVSIKDITEKYRAIEDLKVSEEKLKAVTENILDIICLINLDGTISYINGAALRALGYTEEEMIGKSYRHFVVDKNRKIEKCIFSNKEESTFIEHKLICKNQKEIKVETVFKEFTNNKGNISGYIVVSRNQDIKKELEEMKIKYNEIKEYDRIRGEFFANLSHELRTPLNIIHSSLQLLNTQKENGVEALSDYYMKYEKTIKQNCLRMLRLVNNLIDISKIDSGFIDFNYSNNDIVMLVEDITLSVAPYIEEKNLNIMFDTDTEELKIRCEPEKIERIMLNLISNSVKFTDVGGEIFVNIEVDEKWVYIRVKDSGVGIPKHLREVIFERFVQGDKSLNRQKEGSGIGLALVRSIVNHHNGEVYVEDTSEEGSTFIVKLPNVLGGYNEEIPKEAVQRNIDERIIIEFSDIYDI